MTGALTSRAQRQEVRRIVHDWVATERRTTVDRMRVTRSRYASSVPLLNVHLMLADGTRLRVVYKGTGRSARILPALDVRPRAIKDRAREAWMYDSVLRFDGIADAPRLLSSGRARNGGHWLLMEWAGSVDLSQVGRRAVWCEAASQLARLHEWGESRVEDLPDGALARWDDATMHMSWARRARRAQAEHCRATGVGRDPLAPLWRRYQVVADRLAEMPKTLVHGDFNASNILVMPAADGKRIRVIDWETAGVGPGLIDLASLISGRLPAAQRIAMVAAYRASLGGSRLGALSTDDFNDALSWCRLALAVMWLGWSPRWSPPPAHAHDWRGDALTLARRLGLLAGR